MSVKIAGPTLEKIDRSSPTYRDLCAAAAALAAKDASLWGPAAAPEASIRLNWIDLPLTSRELLPELDALSAWARSTGLTNVILCGMGGSSLAPEVISKTYEKKLSVLDSTDPAQILAAIPADLSTSVVVVGSKSGSTIETASQRALFTELFTQAGLDPKAHMVIVTDPHSPLDIQSRQNGFRTINADPHVGGRYSALSAFGLVPAALMGVDVSVLLDDAAAAAEKFASPDSPAIELAYLLFTQSEQTLAFIDANSNVPGLSDWIEQLVAESTGKSQKGRLPIVIESSKAPVAGPALVIGFQSGELADLVIEASLGEHFILWEWVTALLCRALEVDPFNQPNVTEAKEGTGQLLAQWADGKVHQPIPVFEDENLQVYADESATSLAEALAHFLQKPGYYIAIMAYLARGIDDEIVKSRALLAEKSGRGTTFGWGPRFLHSTGQFHKGGQQNGSFLQITGESATDIDIPEQVFSFHTLLMAQALGDARALKSREFPLVRIHLKNRSEGIAAILNTLATL